jgi:hypothetical protein
LAGKEIKLHHSHDLAGVEAARAALAADREGSGKINFPRSSSKMRKTPPHCFAHLEGTV